MSIRSRMAGRSNEEKLAVVAATIAVGEEYKRQVAEQREAATAAERQRLATPDYTAPSAPLPIQLYPGQVTELGTIRGDLWFVVPHQPEEEVRALYSGLAIPDRGPVMLDPGATYLEGWVDATDERTGRTNKVRVWWPCRRYPAGTFANGGKVPTVPVAPRKPKPLRAVDGLATIPALAPKEARIIPTPGKPKEERVEPLPYGVEPVALPERAGPEARYVDRSGPVRGASAVLAILTRKAGATFTACRYGCHVVTTAERGAMPDGGRELIDRTAPFLAPHVGVTRSPLADIAANAHCHHPDHVDPEQPDAVTIGPGGIYGAPLCADHVA